MKKIILIGAGLIGKERLQAIRLLKGAGKELEISGVYDPFNTDIYTIAQNFETKSLSSIEDAFKLNPDWFFVATPHDVTFEILPSILKRGYKVLIEKPLGRSLSEAKQLFNSMIYPDQLYVGFNYRFFKGINTLLNDVQSGLFGKIISINLVLGHGGDPDMKKGWKLDPVRAGGGCLIDPGIHLLDICNLLSSNIKVIDGLLWKGFWNTGIEEECHLLFKCETFIINLQISIVRWRSTFYLEVNGTEGYGKVSGRNRSYGNQTYFRGKRWGWLQGKTQKESEELILETSGNNVFVDEIDALLFSTTKPGIRPCSAKEALINMELYENCLNILLDRGVKPH